MSQGHSVEFNMNDQTQADPAEIAAIVALLREMIGKLDDMGLRTEGSYVSMAADLLDDRLR